MGNLRHSKIAGDVSAFGGRAVVQRTSAGRPSLALSDVSLPCRTSEAIGRTADISGGLGVGRSDQNDPSPTSSVRNNGRRSTPVMVSRTRQVALPVSQTASAASSGPRPHYRHRLCKSIQPVAVLDINLQVYPKHDQDRRSQQHEPEE
jgi:hypothetical protein